MVLSAGARLGPYEVHSALGAGGMGEVYRARDTRLKREVALKILPESFAHDADRLARFQREAEVLASLNHPNIAAIYGFEESNGTSALVMELVEGDTLADRIARGLIPVDEALPIARQIAEALEAAHEQGIVHRDLKPANIKVRPDGAVKVLDFGLAKLAQNAEVALVAPHATASPTMSGAFTGVGIILGTAAYMAPEQARGKAVDKRADIWAFGCVLFEMLSGARAFDGTDATEMIAAVVRAEPNWSALPASTPRRLRELLERCLQKDPRLRIRDIGDVRFELDESVRTRDSGIAPTTTLSASRWRRTALIVSAALLASMVSGLAVWLLVRADSARVVRTSVSTLGAAALFLDVNDRAVAIAPDGSRVAYIGNNNTGLFVRSLDQLQPTPLTRGSTGTREPFFSPDGEWIGFFEALTTLKKVAATGGPAVTLSTLDGSSRGATWGPDGLIVVATGNPSTGLQLISDAGGATTVLTRPDTAKGERDHYWPHFLPGGGAVLFTIVPNGPIENAQVAVLDLETREQKVVVQGASDARYVPTGHLVYGAGGTVRAVAFDLSRLETAGTAIPVVSEVVTTLSEGAANFGVAGDGTLVYAAGRLQSATRSLIWIDRQGRETVIAAPARAYNQPRISPDGTRLAVSISDEQTDIWIWDIARETLTRATFDPANDNNPVWSADGQRLVLASSRGGTLATYWLPADGTGSIEPLSGNGRAAPSTGSLAQTPTSVSPDGMSLVVEEVNAMGRRELLLIDIATRRTRPLMETPFDERNGEISPNGRWIAYQSNESGEYEVYVRPFPDVETGRWQISTDGGGQPLWSRDGRELFFLTPTGTLMTVAVGPGIPFKAGPPLKLFERPFLDFGVVNSPRIYDVALDGKRFVMRKTVAGADQTATEPGLVVVQNWTEELKRLVPAP